MNEKFVMKDKFYDVKVRMIQKIRGISRGQAIAALAEMESAHVDARMAESEVRNRACLRRAQACHRLRKNPDVAEFFSSLRA